jgi:Tfp pilus tip-associated adhesin PilY1
MYQVRFYVKTDETPLQGANVILYRVDGAFHGESDNNGVVTFSYVPSGVYNYMVVLDGYAHVEDVVKVYENVDITVVLKPLT